jgi:predicted XRE-type DNA-binding protein
MNTIGVWTFVVGYENTYEISISGSITSLPRKGCRHRRILKPQFDRYGRPRVCLCLHGKKTTRLVAHLVADAFLSTRGPTDTVLRHLNDDPNDNRVENLAWGTYHDNAQDSMRNNTFQRGSAHCRAKLTEDIVREIRRLYATGAFSQQELAGRFGVSQRAICQIVRRRTWKHVV